MTRRIGVLGVAGVIAIAGCGGGNSSNSNSGSGGSGAAATSTPTPSSGGGHTLQLAADPNGALKFDKSTLQAKSGSVTIDFSNMSTTPHAVAVEGHGLDKDGKIITGAKTSLTVNLKPGKYVFYCPVDGHRQAGMQGSLVVR
jgi:plastocyanin